MKVLITGITGFIGSELAKRLVEEGHEVYGFVRHVVSRANSSIEEIMDRIKLITCDITDFYSVKLAMSKVNPEIVLHLAALSPVRLSFEHPFDYKKSILGGTMNIAEAIRELYGSQKVRLVAASTAEVYGIQAESPFTEDMALEPSSPYAVMKAAMDMYLRMLVQVYDFNVVIMRTSNTFGRKHDPSFFTEYLITSMLKGKDIHIGAPESVRDYNYIDSHVDGYLLAMKAPEAKGHAFNIAGTRAYKNLEWAYKIADLIEFPKSKINFETYPPGYPDRPLSSDQPYLVLSSEKAKRVLGWKERVTPEEGLNRSIRYWKKKLNL